MVWIRAVLVAPVLAVAPAFGLAVVMATSTATGPGQKTAPIQATARTVESDDPNAVLGTQLNVTLFRTTASGPGMNQVPDHHDHLHIVIR
jgi:hypothetical protein